MFLSFFYTPDHSVVCVRVCTHIIILETLVAPFSLTVVPCSPFQSHYRYTHQLEPSRNQPWPIVPLDWSPLSTRWHGRGGAYLRTVLSWNPMKELATGKFWITLEDFLSHFATVFVCRVPSSFKDSRRDHWAWDKGLEGGVLTCPTGHLNPQWCIEVRKEGPLFISLAQGQPDEASGIDQCYIMLALLPQSEAMTRPLVQADMELPGFHFSGRPRKQQQVSIDAKNVLPGKYTIVCCTFEPNRRAPFSLGVHAIKEGALGTLARLYGD